MHGMLKSYVTQPVNSCSKTYALDQPFKRATLSIAQMYCRKMSMSVIRQYCVDTAKYILKLYRHQVAKHYAPNIMQYSNGNPPNGGVECTWGMKNRDFRPTYRFISEMIQDRAIVTMECEQETVPKLSNGAIFSDLERRLNEISRSRRYLTLNMLETLRDTDTVTMKY